MIENHIKSLHKSILCLNGDLSNLPFLKKTKLPIFAADGAGNTLLRAGIKPSLIIGDLDSMHLSSAQKENIECKHEPCQNSSDFQKALKHLKETNLLPTLILGMNGGHIDHILNNINIFLESDNIFYAPPILGYVLKGSHPFSFPQNTKVSLLGIPSALVSTTGFKWELKKDLLTFPGNTSCFNRTLSQNSSIHVHEGSLLALFYLEQTQDAGSSLS
jgi:thiamine pyrophosphokinase